MHILTKTLWIVIFIILISETATIVKYTSNSEENKNEQETTSDITLKDDANTVKKVKLIMVDGIIPIPFTLFCAAFTFCLVIIIIEHYCPYWLFYDLDEIDISDYIHHYRRRSESDQPRVQLNHYQVVYTRNDESIEGNENTEENY
nr:PREDICTED: uncharacterized protein LOC105675050 isoform X3 [Linepithema humile]